MRTRNGHSFTGFSSSSRACAAGVLILCAATFGVLVATAQSWAGPAVPFGASALAAESTPGKPPHARLSLLIDQTQIAAGQPVRVGVLFELDPGWHIYWKFSGESGLPTRLTWDVEGAEVGPLQWPAPSVFREADGFITTYGYKDRVLLAQDLRFVPTRGANATETIRLRVVADFLVCEIQCVPGKATLERDLVLSTSSQASDAESRALFQEFAGKVPVTAEPLGLQLEALYSQTAIRPGDTFRAGIAVVDCSANAVDPEGRKCGRFAAGPETASDTFVPDLIQGFELKTTGTRPHPFVEGAFLVTLEGRASPDAFQGTPRLRGVLALQGPKGPVATEVDLEIPVAEAGAQVTQLDVPWLAPAAAISPSSDLSLWRALALAFLGGLILNLMPCVFPVLAIKLAGVAELAHRSRPEVLKNSGAYLLGILVCMGALAGVVLALRSAGVAVGWGFQFQEPLFVLAVGVVVVVFALNLFGVFEVSLDLTRVSQIGGESTGTARSFFDGLLAVVLATPCSAPFLGPAVGFAFAANAIVVVAIFLAIGLGLALPYAAVSLVPGLARVMPRPGQWMVVLRQSLGFALLGTAVWLLWILGNVGGVDAATAVLAHWVAVAFVAWVFGTLQASGRTVGAPAVAVVGLLALGALATYLPLESEAGAAGVEAKGEGFARPFDAAAVQAVLGQGKPVFVYFTADWCLTCKVNERVFAKPEVRAELERAGFGVFVGDWTRRDETIRAELARFGRAAVPLYLVYSPAKPGEPELLSEVLTVDGFLGALRRAAPSASAQSAGLP